VTDSDATTPQLRVLAGNPSATDLAAVTAVVSALVAEDQEQRMAEPSARSSWSLSQRPLRRELVPGPGAWNRGNL
jgi:hypothetical protein